MREWDPPGSGKLKKTQIMGWRWGGILSLSLEEEERRGGGGK